MDLLANLIEQLLKLDAEPKSADSLELTAVEIADALWLARYLPPPSAIPHETPSRELTDTVDLKPNSEEESPPPDAFKMDSSFEEVKEADLVQMPSQQQRSPDNSASDEMKSARKERIYAGYALSKRREIERALRPLRRRAFSAIESELDEDETVERSAQYSLLNIQMIDPVLRAAQKRWLEVDIIVDNSNSMVVWQETALEFGQLVRHQGFRDVRMWHLDTENNPAISPFRKHGFIALSPFTKLPPAQGDRIVLVITDCVASAWQNFKVLNLLAQWAKHSSVTLFQVWPEYFWYRTILKNLANRASAYSPAVPNIRLITQREPDPFFDLLNEKDSQQTTNSVFIPVVPLEDPDALSKWAQMVAGVGRFWLPAIEVRGIASPHAEATDLQEFRPAETNPRKLVERFQSTASPTTQELGGLLASVPLELPIMRLVQETLPHSRRLHLSEFLTSGLVYHKREPENALMDEPVFEFFDGVRALLRRTVRTSDTINTLRKVGDFINERVGQGKEFTALRTSTIGDIPLIVDEQTLPFAKLQLEVLKSLGPFHRIAAEQLQEEIDSVESFIELNKQLQSFEFDIVTFVPEDEPSPSLPTFESETITVDTEDKEIWWERKTTSYFTEDLNGVSLEMVLIPAGSFDMGAPAEELESKDSERPQHTVIVPQFLMGKYPVTQAQWRAVASMQQVNRELKVDPSRFKGENRPVEQVSWHDAVEFYNRLSAHTNRRYRLPSEAEWEYACRARTKTPFHFGATISSKYANYDGIRVYGDGVRGEDWGETTDVGSFRVANNFGLFDMHGNVWEWCGDRWHENYINAPEDGCTWVAGGDSERRVLRGGSWGVSPGLCRSAYRLSINSSYVGNRIGFRVVCCAFSTLNQS